MKAQILDEISIVLEMNLENLTSFMILQLENVKSRLLELLECSGSLRRLEHRLDVGFGFGYARNFHNKIVNQTRLIVATALIEIQS